MTLEQELTLRGYTKHVADHYRVLNNTDTLYQKRISDSKGKKYFINIWYYPAQRYGHTDLPESIQAEVQFTGDGVTDEHLDVKLFTKDLDKIEEVFENMWVKLGLGYYELWDAY
jgi:hypothetical protein